MASIIIPLVCYRYNLSINFDRMCKYLKENSLFDVDYRNNKCP